MFHLLSGDLKLIINQNIIELVSGDTYLIKRNDIHSFMSQNGAIFEEISNRINDSYYEDASIAELDPMQRKTVLDFW
jgi:hypothetical protein